MKILFFNRNIGYGGASKIMAGLASSLASHGHAITFLSSEGFDVLQPLHENIIRVEKNMTRIRVRGIKRIAEIVALHKYLKKNQFDIAIAFLSPQKYMLALACKLTGTKVLLSERGDPGKKTRKHKVLDRIMEHATNNADMYVFQTEGAKGCYPLKVQKRSVIIPNPVLDGNIPLPFKGERKKTIVNVARLEIFQKRQDVLLEAFAKIAFEFPGYKLALYGDGPDEIKLKRMAEEKNLTGRVLFMGVSRDIYNDIKDVALFVLSSDYEGIPNALMEAMSIGLPCISTDCSPGGARVLIHSGQNGLLVPASDPDKLAHAMAYMLAHTKKAEGMGAQALRIVHEFSKEEIFGRWENFMHEGLRRQ